MECFFSDNSCNTNHSCHHISSKKVPSKKTQIQGVSPWDLRSLELRQVQVEGLSIGTVLAAGGFLRLLAPPGRWDVVMIGWEAQPKSGTGFIGPHYKDSRH